MDITPDMARAELARRELSRRQSGNIQKQAGIGSIPGDIADATTNLVMGAGEKAMKLPEEFQEAGQQFVEHPFSEPPRAARGIMSGLLEGGKQLYNLPLNLNTYLGSKGIFPFKQTSNLAEKLKVGETGLQKLIMGEPKKGDQLFQDVGMLGSALIAPETAGIRPPAITARGITRQMSRHKSQRVAQAREDYGQLFNDASNQGLNYALPGENAVNNWEVIVDNSRPIHHRAYVEYLHNPTLENAHWAQSELGGLERHLEKIANKNGLSPIEHQTLRAATEARQNIRQSMFSENAIGRSPELAERYQNLSSQYRENVIPYTRLQPLSEVEQGIKRPKKAVKELMKDEQFMMELSRRYPGLLAHTPIAKKVGLGTAGLLGYEELKKIFSGR